MKTMQHIDRSRYAGVAALLAMVFLVSCETPPQAGAMKFHDAAAADVVVKHFRWEHLNLIKPNYREGGFLIPVTRDTLGPALDRLGVSRGLAVVALGWNYTEADLEKLTQEWRDLLRGLGFQHVVAVHATGRGDDVTGAWIIHDSR